MATTDRYFPLAQTDADLAFAAEGPGPATEAAAAAITPPDALGRTFNHLLGIGAAGPYEPPRGSCQQTLTLSFFFDGTGNNIDADTATDQQSNVARLYQCHPLNGTRDGLHAFYCYGIGTYFREIGDPGGEPLSLAFGARGQDRLDWAFRKFDERLHAAELRAMNPTNKILSVRLAVFGFSRGAALARAFVRDLQNKRCTLRDGRHVLTRGNIPIEVYFLGLFDTVASFGLPMSSNNTPISTTAGLASLYTTVKLRALSSLSGIRTLPFGAPGADPAPGEAHGHRGPADDLKIVPLVQRCVHLVAAHEYRNSFPLDSCLHGEQYPPNLVEMVYPGAHSDVGGGYQPGEGGRSAHQAELLSMVALRVMHAEAVKCGVPLYDLEILPGRIKASFAMDEQGQARYGELLEHWTHYMQATAAAGNIGAQCLAHMKQYYRWRFYDIARREQAAKAGGRGPADGPEDGATDNGTAGDRTVRRNEAGFALTRDRLRRDVARRQKELGAAKTALDRAEQREFAAWWQQMESGRPIDPRLIEEAQDARDIAAEAGDAYLSAKAELDTYADDSALLANRAAYDERLLEDVRIIRQSLARDPSLVLRPHYRNMVEAYQDEFIHGNGLRDDRVIAFFDRYVHDSLSAFARDATLPSDPRVLYIGGNAKMEHADLRGAAASMVA